MSRKTLRILACFGMFLMVFLAAIFFLAVDWILGSGVRFIIGMGG